MLEKVYFWFMHNIKYSSLKISKLLTFKEIDINSPRVFMFLKTYSIHECMQGSGCYVTM